MLLHDSHPFPVTTALHHLEDTKDLELHPLFLWESSNFCKALRLQGLPHPWLFTRTSLLPTAVRHLPTSKLGQNRSLSHWVLTRCLHLATLEPGLLPLQFLLRKSMARSKETRLPLMVIALPVRIGLFGAIA